MQMLDPVNLAAFAFCASAVSLVCAWWWWVKLPQKFPPPKARSEAGFGALVVGTISTVLPFVPWMWPFDINYLTWRNWMYVGWGLAILAFVLSFFARGKLRVAEMTMGLGMCPVWYELIQFNKHYM